METKKTKKDTKGSKEHKKNWQEQTATVDDIRAFLDERILPWSEDRGDYILELAMTVVVKDAGITQKLNTVWLGRAFVELGFQKRTYHNVRGYVVVRRSMEEMRSMRCQMVHGDDTADTANTVIF